MCLKKKKKLNHKNRIRLNIQTGTTYRKQLRLKIKEFMRFFSHEQKYLRT